MWCVQDPDHVWRNTPCTLQTLGASGLLLYITFVIIFHLRDPITHPPRNPLQRLSAPRDFRNFILTALLICLHIESLLFYVLPNPDPEFFHYFYEACFLIMWMGCMCLGAFGRRRLRWIFNGITATCIYICTIISWLCKYPDIFINYGVNYTELNFLIVTLIQILLSSWMTNATKNQKFEYAEIDDAEEAEMAINKEKDSNWVQIFYRSVIYVWPKSNILRFKAFISLIILFLVRVLKLVVPITYKYVVDLLASISVGTAKYSGYFDVFYPYPFYYLLAIALVGSGSNFTSILTNIRSIIFFPISQDAYKRLSLEIFSHILDLDLNFHLHRKTGEITRVMERGTLAIQNILSTVFFSLGPQFIDMFFAIVYISGFLQVWIGVVMMCTIGLYMPITFIITEIRQKLRKKMNEADNQKSFRATDAFLNFETVKYFSNEDFEVRQYSKSVEKYQKHEFQWTLLNYILNIVQSLIISVGTVVGTMLCIKSVLDGDLSVGDFTLFLILMTQLFAPLGFLGMYYSTIQSYATDIENLFELLDRQPAIKDMPGAKDLLLKNGSVEFKNVRFGYDAQNPIVKDISFKVAGGNSIGIVGETGSGKSTLLRLFFRLYELNAGEILIDGQPINTIKMKSLQKVISYVPQDSVLFNDTIYSNINYGNVNAPEEAVYKAAKMACIHDRIMDTFPNKYETMVGERGLRLSGGEKQRVAFARAMLKNTPIVILDEATSALDSVTEKKIQLAMYELRKDRTMIVVAHRLSTICDLNHILVMSNGEVVEHGTHKELLDLDGTYAELWRKQLETKNNDASSSEEAVS